MGTQGSNANICMLCPAVNKLINKYYTILTNKYLSLENAYLGCVVLKILNNMHFLFQNLHDNNLACDGVKTALVNGQLMSTSIGLTD